MSFASFLFRSSLMLTLMAALGGTGIALGVGVVVAISTWGVVAVPLVLLIPPSIILLIFVFVIAEDKSGLS